MESESTRRLKVPVEDDLDFEMTRPEASQLGPKQLCDELERRGIRPTGFTEDDVKLLQRFLDEEYEAEQADLLERRKTRDALRKKDEQDEQEQRLVCNVAGILCNICNVTQFDGRATETVLTRTPSYRPSNASESQQL